MKKIIISVIVIIIFLINSTQCIYAASPEEKGKEKTTSGETTASNDGDWVGEAFSAASSFLNNSTVTDELGIVSPIFEKFKSIVKAINVVLMVLLMGLSIIALSVTGVRYITSGASPEQKEIAKKSLHTIFIGMAIGFGAYVIWRIAMSLIEIFIEALS